MWLAGTSLVTTALAPMALPSPMVMGPSAHGDVVFQGGVAFCLGEHLAAQGYPVVQHHAVADVSGFANDHSHAVVDEEAPTDGGAGVDFHAGEKARELGEDARREFQSAFPQDVGDAVGPDGV